MDNYVEPQKLKEVYVTIMDVRDCIVLCYAMKRIPNTFCFIQQKCKHDEMAFLKSRKCE